MVHSSFYKGNAIINVYNPQSRIRRDASAGIRTKYGLYDASRIHPLELLPKDKDSNVYLRGLVLEWYFTFSSLPVITDQHIYIYHFDKYKFEYLMGQSTRDEVERCIRDYIDKHNPRLLIPVR